MDIGKQVRTIVAEELFPADAVIPIEPAFEAVKTEQGPQDAELVDANRK